MQTMVTTLTVRVPIGVATMEYLAQATKIMAASRDAIQDPKADVGVGAVELSQHVESDAPAPQASAPRRRGPNKPKAQPDSTVTGPTSGPVTAEPVTKPKDTSKPGAEVTQPAWKKQADAPADAGQPAFMKRTA